MNTYHLSDLLPDDWHKINATAKKQLFFGRKFEPVVSQSVLDMVDVWIDGGNRFIDHSSRTRYWQNMYHHIDVSPKPDEAMLDVARALCELGNDVFLPDTDASTSTFHFSALYEITSYHKDDLLEGILLRFSNKDEKTKQIKHFELLMSNRNDVTVQHVKVRHGELTVSTKFDPKELIFRNFINAMDTDSEPVLMYSFSEATSGGRDDSLQLKAVWVDPNGDIAATNDMDISKNSTKEIVKLGQSKEPLVHGIWTVIVAETNTLQPLAWVPFLVMPKSVDDGVKNGQKQSYAVSAEDQGLLAKLLKKPQDNLGQKLAQLNNDLLQNGKEKGRWLQKKLLKEFYTVKSMCEATSIRDTTNENDYKGHLSLKLPNCEDETEWSSLSFDFKSSISHFDEQTKLLV